MATKKQTVDAPTQADQQTRTEPGEVWEVLAQQANGHRTVHRVRASGRDDAERAVRDALDAGARLLGSALAGQGLGSGD